MGGGVAHTQTRNGVGVCGALAEASAIAWPYQFATAWAHHHTPTEVSLAQSAAPQTQGPLCGGSAELCGHQPSQAPLAEARWLAMAQRPEGQRWQLPQQHNDFEGSGPSVLWSPALSLAPNSRLRTTCIVF